MSKAITEKNILTIEWIKDFNWSNRVKLGRSQTTFYNFSALWNTRDEYWSISIATLDNIPLIQGVKMVLNEDLLKFCYTQGRPDCILVPIAGYETISRITDENMFNGDVKLYHITVDDF